MGLLWGVVYIPGVTPLKKINFPSWSNCHLWIASRLGVGLCAHFPTFTLGFCSAPGCAGSCTCWHNLCSYMQQPCCGWKTVFFDIIQHLWLMLVPPLFLIYPRPWGEGSDKDILFQTECFKVALSAWFSCESLLITIYCKRFLWGLSDALIYVYRFNYFMPSLLFHFIFIVHLNI